MKVRSERFILRDNKPYHKIAKTRAWLVRHVKGKTNVCVCTNLLAPLSTMQFCYHRAAPPHPRIYRVHPPPRGGKFHNILFYCLFIVILFKTLLEVYFFALYQDLVHPLLTVYYQQRNSSFAWKEEAVAGGVLPYITYTGMCRPTGS